MVGEELVVLPEDRNIHDQHAVAVIRDDKIVGHILYYILKHSREISCVISCTRKHGVGLEVPCVYRICGKSRFIERLKRWLGSRKKS